LKPRLPILALFVAGLSGCGPNYSPDTYSTNAVQQANKVEQGLIVGVRQVGVSAAGTTGTISGAAAGGIAGAQAGSGPISALTALGGSLVGGLAGSAVEHATADTAAFEYIVRKSNNELVSVTQKDKTPLALGLHVLVIAGNQARIVPDYTVAADLQPKPEAPVVSDKPKPPAPEVDKPPPAEAAAATPGPAPSPSAVPAATPPPAVPVMTTPAPPPPAPPPPGPPAPPPATETKSGG
jgi:outer membrane lipoprotein SlyB